MPQPKSSARRSGGAAAASTTAGRASAKSSSRAPAKRAATKATSKSPAAKATPKRAAAKATPKRAAAKATPKRAAAKATPKRAAAKATPKHAAAEAPARRTTRSSAEESLSAILAALIDRLARGVVISGERLQETIDDAVTRGRITRGDAEDLAKRLINGGRKQTEDIVSDLEVLLTRSRSELLSTGRLARQAPGDRVLREVDRARRAVGIGPSFPILGYDELDAARISARTSDLNAAELRKVRDYESRRANRKSVLEAIERALRAQTR